MFATLRGTLRATFGVLVFGFVPAHAASGQSENVTLLAHVNNYESYSACWGYTSPEGVEIAIIGTGYGCSFVDVTNPASPEEVLFVPGSASIWREIKTFGHYAYIVEDECCDGLIVVDLSDPLEPFVANTDTTFFGTAHTVWVDTDRGLLFANGTSDGVQIFDLNADPVSPPLVHAFNEFYVHDMSTQGDVAYLAAIRDGFLATADLTTLPDTMQVLDTAVTEDSYTHNAWPSADGRYVYTTDEVTGGHLTILDVSDPRNVFQVGAYINDRDLYSTAHNVFIEGNFAYVAWYKAGLEVLDLSDPIRPVRVGYYDTYAGSGPGFSGAWGVYPFAESGHIYVSDRSTGLYVLQFNPNTGSLEGTVTDLDTGDPILGATVQATTATEARSVMTEFDGSYRLVLDPGQYSIITSAFGYSRDLGSQTITVGDSSTASFQLDPLPTAPLTGVVTSGGALTGVRIAIAETPLVTTTVANGSYSFPSVPQDVYVISASRFGFGASDAVVTINSGTNVKNFALNTSPIARTMESDPSWTIGASGDNATAGIWTLVEPLGTSLPDGRHVQPEVDHTTNPGQLCFVTGQGMSPSQVGEADVDGGRTTLLSAIYDLSAIPKPSVRVHRWYANSDGAQADDVFRIDVSSNGGSTWTNLETLATTRRFWEQLDFYLPHYITPSSQMRFRFVAEDQGLPSVVEAGIDDFEIFGLLQTTAAPDQTSPIATMILGATPNPLVSGQVCTLRFQVAAAQDGTFEIIDAGGRRVIKLLQGSLHAGTQTLVWDGRDEAGRLVPAGVYFQRFSTREDVHAAKLIVVR